MPLLISPGSEKTRQTLKDSGALGVFEELESILLTNACGPCCGSWDRQDMEKVSKTRKVSLSITNCAQGTQNSIITSYNRNFTGRLDGNPATHIFLASPEMVMAKIFSDDLGFNPVTDTITTEDDNEFKFELPTGDALPLNGFSDAEYVYASPPSAGRESIQVQISDSSERLQRLSPFPPGPTSDPENCVILIKAQGKCTTDHITPAGPWFRFRGHLDNISDNTLIGAVNAENGNINSVTNWLTGESGAVPQTARAYKQVSQPWVVIGDHNYGEGSSREHAALQPRHLGCLSIIAKSFARIHETNLKKQGVLALPFCNEEDYNHVNSSDRISIHGVADLEPGKTLTLRVVPTTGKGEEWTTQVRHTMSLEEIEYFRAGSALNLMANRKKSTQSSPTL
jgi:aconitate hydratase